MKEVICKKCNLVILDSTNLYQNCGSKGIEYMNLKNPDNKILEKYINDGFEIVCKKPFIEKFDEENFHGFEYELQRPI